MNLRSETLTLLLAEQTSLSSPEPATLELRRADRLLRLKLLDPGVVAALTRLAGGPATFSELEKVAHAADPGTDLARLDAELERLGGKLWLRFGCAVAGTELLQATVQTDLYPIDATPPPVDAPLQLSRFAYLHRVGEGLVLDSPASYTQVQILVAALAAPILNFVQPRTIAEACVQPAGNDPRAVAAAIGFLHSLGVLARLDESGRHPDEARPELAQRELHDLVLHAASRRGLTGNPVGGTFRFRGVLPPAPARKQPPEGARIPLPRTDPDRPAGEDATLTRVMESRASIRRHGTTPITVNQLGEFLHRVARVKASVGVDEAAGRPYEATKRPYPSAGAGYDLEFYLTVRTCAGLDPGFYHYDPFAHQLTLMCTRAELTGRVVHDAYTAAGGHAMPQLVITLASRFPRLSWKYAGMAYAATLKNVGVAYHAMYLVATAMELAPCALGCGDSATFAALTGLDPVSESAVGEFILGSRAEPNT